MRLLTTLSNMIRLNKTALLVCTFIFFTFNLSACSDTKQEREKLESLDGVLSVDSFSRYENKVTYDVTIQGGSMRLHHYGSDIFSDSWYIGISKINSSTISCIASDGYTIVNAFNVIDFMSSRSNVELKKVSDMFKHFNEVSDTVSKKLSKEETLKFASPENKDFYFEVNCSLESLE